GKSATRCRSSARTRGEGSKETASGNETESCPGLLRCLQGDQENCAAAIAGSTACRLRSKCHASRLRRTTRGCCSHQSRSECEAARRCGDGRPAGDERQGSAVHQSLLHASVCGGALQHPQEQTSQ